MMTSHYFEITVHLASAWIAGSLIGLERSFHGRPAGFRTHALVCLASAVLMMITVYQSDWLPFALPDTIRADPQRMAQGIMTGIGFLGAGVIFQEGRSVRGLTTAASIWITAALGILYGVGFYYPAVFGTLARIGISGDALAKAQARTSPVRLPYLDDVYANPHGRGRRAGAEPDSTGATACGRILRGRPGPRPGRCRRPRSRRLVRQARTRTQPVP